MGATWTVTLGSILLLSIHCSTSESISTLKQSDTITVDGDVALVVQFSDLHFSVHHPDRARDFLEIVPPILSLIKPSLVLITGDLTDGKSKDLLTMKQDEDEWIEYRNVMNEVIEKSGLDKSIFYDIRGNHDNFGVPSVGSSFDFFSKYSINSENERRGQVNSVTIQTAARKLLFVGLDSTMSIGLRGPTNLFGHPTDTLLEEINVEFSQSNSTEPVTKISFGHFPLSFSAASSSGKTLKEVFLKNSVSAYLCGHLHTGFGKNLKRNHHSKGDHLIFSDLFQLNAQLKGPEITDTCSSNTSSPSEEFWELEMGDWRKSRAIRVLTIDRGELSFIDTNFKLGAQRTIILPTFPLDSRFTSTLSATKYKCKPMDPSYSTIRALIFSFSPVLSIVARIYDSRSGNLDMVFEEIMNTQSSFGKDLYETPWNYQAFEDSSPDRYWLQIEVVDTNGRSTLSELRPFSVNGLRSKLSWTWKEFFVMGCQWDALYYPILWFFYFFALFIFLIPKFILSFSKRQYNYKSLNANKGFVNSILLIFNEYYSIPFLWWGLVVYLFYLVLFPWLIGHVSTVGGETGYMTYKGWVMNFNKHGPLEFIGSPDVMVVVLPHLIFVVYPTFLVTWAFASEKGFYRYHIFSLSSKKEDDPVQENSCQGLNSCRKKRRFDFLIAKRWIRYVLVLVSLAICWKHFKSCRALKKAFEMNPFLHFPVYSFSMPLVLAYSFYKTMNV